VVTKENLIIVLPLSKVIFNRNMYQATPGHSRMASLIHISDENNFDKG
jgi:hypothetical protein